MYLFVKHSPGKVVFLLCIGLLHFLYSYSQIKNWQHLDLDKDGIFGISMDKAYSVLLQKKKSKTIIVAVLDSGIDTTHEDLKSILWTNTNDGSHGKNFISNEVGKEDIARLAYRKRAFYDDLPSEIPKEYKSDYKRYWKTVDEYEKHISYYENLIVELQHSKGILQSIIDRTGKRYPTIKDLKEVETKNTNEQVLVNMVVERLPNYSNIYELKIHEIDQPLQEAKNQINVGLNKLSVETENNETNTDVSNDAIGLVIHPDYSPYHGTHIAGIIGAVRDNRIGINGIADNVRIMMVKVYSNIKELRDNNLARAIKYAVDNGAKVINISLGRYFTLDKGAIDSMVKYAESKNVLIIHAAGNEGYNLDESDEQFPNRKYANHGGEANNWIEVGASGPKNDSTLIEPFSNYGKESVDIFAPGENIYSTIPGSKYENRSGTSMAAPIVAGLAAIIWEYYPNLSAVQVKSIIFESVVKPEHTVILKSSKGVKRVFLRDICVSGGVVNAFNALRIAEKYAQNH